MNPPAIRSTASRCLAVLLALLCPLLALHAVPAVAKGTRAGSAQARPAPARQYDSQGRHTGRIDADGRRYDSQGRYQGRTDLQSGRMYDSQGRYIGKTDAAGRFYDAQGVHTGRIDASGRIYSAQGVYQGRVDADGRQYDAQGRYTGRLTSDSPAAPSPNPPAPGDSNAARTRATQVEQSRQLSPSTFCTYGDADCARP
ncbi:5-fold beta-flower protein [Uliginosibacterium aquaticum]|uniref:Type IV secretion protein Rhs n=1 Tax=Uliginosibacterium aquaticum TaxID=2731212 RepID=A0ABX2IFZ5_9RHOO|nr:hypothetical protein [Uliginosibacterium aquaticum]NSL53499.1 hypothetical protein [Uliginosibacterium aquaticum]